MEVIEVPIWEVKIDKAAADIKLSKRPNIEELMVSIQQEGMISPIFIDENKNLIAGLRRLIACRRLKHTTIRACICSGEEVINQQMMAPRMYVRSTIEDNRYAAAHLRRCGYTVKQIAARTGWSERTIRRYLNFLKRQ